MLVLWDSGEITPGGVEQITCFYLVSTLYSKKPKTLLCTMKKRCKVCQFAWSLVNNRLVKLQFNLSSAERQFRKSLRHICSKCQFMGNHDSNLLSKTATFQICSSSLAVFFKPSQTRGNTERFVCNLKLKKRLFHLNHRH